MNTHSLSQAVFVLYLVLFYLQLAFSWLEKGVLKKDRKWSRKPEEQEFFLLVQTVAVKGKWIELLRN